LKMGCFSYKCKSCDNPIWSDSFNGHQCVGFYLLNGKVIEEVRGEYNSYGGTFEKPSWSSDEWGRMVDVHYNDDNTSGFAFFHEACYNSELPTTKSADDPFQGWLDFGDCKDTGTHSDTHDSETGWEIEECDECGDRDVHYDGLCHECYNRLEEEDEDEES